MALFDPELRLEAPLLDFLFLLLLLLTSRVSQPPTMLRPRPVRPLEMSMVVSQPGMMGQVVGSQARVEGVDERLRPETEEAKGVIL